MIIHLPKEIERDILAQVHNGHFASVDDALVIAWQTLRRQAAAPAVARPGKKAGPPKQAEAPRKPCTPEELNQRLLAAGLISKLPDPSLDLDDDDPEDQPVTIEGEPLSETILRDRR